MREYRATSRGLKRKEKIDLELGWKNVRKLKFFIFTLYLPDYFYTLFVPEGGANLALQTVW